MLVQVHIIHVVINNTMRLRIQSLRNKKKQPPTESGDQVDSKPRRNAHCRSAAVIAGAVLSQEQNTLS